MKWTSAGVVTAFALAATNASALPVIDMSVSAGLNRSNLDADERLFFPTRSYSGTEPRLTFNASVGPLIGIEIGWSELAANSTPVTVVAPGGTFEDELLESGAALWVAYAPSVELGAFELTGKLGLARTTREYVIQGYSIDLSNSDNEALIGVAGTYWVTSLVGLRVDAERIGDDVSQVGLSLTIGF